MITQLLETLRIERLDDIPLLLAQLQRMQLARLLDQHYPTDPHWAGQLTFGEVAAVWLAQLVSTGDHRLCQLEGWAEQRLDMLSACLGKPVRALDFHDDRLADMLDALADADTWATFEQELNASLVRVYQLPTARVRVDTTTARTFAAPDAGHQLFQFGHSKDHRPDLPQIKVALATLDPLGMPLVTAVVPGNTADDPLYVPVIRQVQQSLAPSRRLFVGDCKMAALQTRAYIAQSGDCYLCPLSATQVPPAQWQQLLEPVWAGTQELIPVYQSGSPGTLIASGFWKLVLQRATCAVTGREVLWHEQQLMVRSVAHAERHAAVLDAKLAKAQAALLALNERKRGKKRLTGEGIRTRAADLVQQHGVADLLDVQVQTTTRKVPQRKYQARAAGVRVVAEATVRVAMNTAAIAAKKRLGGWRVYVANGMQLTIQVAVQAYRGQYGVEHEFARLKGKTLQLTPLYLQSEARVEGLVHLLSVGLRLLSLIEYGVRQGLSRGKEKLRGIYPGQKGRGTLTPSAELLLGAFRGLDLRIVVKRRKRHRSVGRLNAVQKRILELLDLPVTIYHGLGGSFSGSG
jgi:transposase